MVRPIGSLMPCSDRVRRSPRRQIGRLRRSEPRPGPVGETDGILEVDEKVLLRCRSLVWEGQKAGTTYAQPDALLAATAIEHERGVATRDTEDFGRAGLRLLNPWQTERMRPASLRTTQSGPGA